MGFLEIKMMPVIEDLKEKFGKKLLAIEEKDVLTIEVARENFVELVSYLKDRGFNHLIDLCGVDYLNYTPFPKRERFELIYHLFNIQERILVRIKVPIPEKDAWQYSLVSLWKTADWFERECYDMFGIRFKGHPDLRRLLMPEDWVGHPLRKDYPLFLSEEQEWKVYKRLKEEDKGETL